MEEKKSILWELDIKAKKGDGPNTKSLLNRLELDEGKKGNVNGMKFDGVKIIIQEGKEFKLTKNARFESKLSEFGDLVREAKKEHEGTAVAQIEDSVPDVFVSDDIAESVLNDSLKKLNEEISERSDQIAVKLTKNEIREFRGLLERKFPTLEEQREGGITVKNRIDAVKIEENEWRQRAERTNDPEQNFFTNP